MVNKAFPALASLLDGAALVGGMRDWMDAPPQRSRR